MQFATIFNLQGTLFLLIIMGMVGRKSGALSEPTTKVLTDLTINILLPCMIIHSFMIAFNWETLRNFAVILAIATLAQIISYLFARFGYKKYPKDLRHVMQYASVCSNSGFLGNPIAEGVYGEAGLMYASIFLIPQRIVMWSAGISFFEEGKADRMTIIKKVLTHPCIVAVYIGFVLMISQWQPPAFLSDTIQRTGASVTPISMILIGTILADAGNVKEMILKTITDVHMIKITFLRLIILPGIVFCGCTLLHVPELLRGVSVLLTGMPAAATTAILAKRYECNAVFAAQMVVFTTILSLLTVPVWCMFLG